MANKNDSDFESEIDIDENIDQYDSEGDNENNINSENDSAEEVTSIVRTTNPNKLSEEEKRERKRERERQRRKKLKQKQLEDQQRLKELEAKHKRGRPKKREREEESIEKPEKIIKKPKQQEVILPKRVARTPEEKKNEIKIINKELKKYEKGENPYLKEFARSSAFLKASIHQFKQRKAKRNEKKEMIMDAVDNKFRSFMKEYITAQKQVQKMEETEQQEKQEKKKKVSVDEEKQSPKTINKVEETPQMKQQPKKTYSYKPHPLLRR